MERLMDLLLDLLLDLLMDLLMDLLVERLASVSVALPHPWRQHLPQRASKNRGIRGPREVRRKVHGYA